MTSPDLHRMLKATQLSAMYVNISRCTILQKTTSDSLSRYR